ncbi:hypothetical protein BGX38DRAFT_357520 [Terfezia claveryi]|nr:hypothetical protein BGX38DRAFT_357520 [Terfezia claveryi]
MKPHDKFPLVENHNTYIDLIETTGTTTHWLGSTFFDRTQALLRFCGGLVGWHSTHAHGETGFPGTRKRLEQSGTISFEFSRSTYQTPGGWPRGLSLTLTKLVCKIQDIGRMNVTTVGPAPLNLPLKPPQYCTMDSGSSDDMKPPESAANTRARAAR